MNNFTGGFPECPVFIWYVFATSELAKQETSTPSWHLVSPLVSWGLNVHHGNVCATMTMHQFCIDRQADRWSTVRHFSKSTKADRHVRLIESITTLRRGQRNPIRVTMIWNLWRGLPSHRCCKLWKQGWNSLDPFGVLWLFFSHDFIFNK